MPSQDSQSKQFWIDLNFKKKKVKMKIVAWIVLGIILCIIAVLIYYLVVGAILFKFVFSRRSVVSRVLKKDFQKKLNDHKVDLGWWEKVKFQKVQTQSFDQLKLVGHFFEANSNKTVIVCHGFGGSYREMQQYCKFFHDKNFNVLAVDMRAHGDSEGHCIGYGWLDRKDVCSWVKFINDKRPEDKILLFGLSMGASSVCMASAEKGLNNVVAIVSDCAYANADREISFVMKKKKLFSRLLKKHAYSYAKRLYGFDVMQADAIKQVKQCKIPILFIHGQEDDFVPLENVNNLFNATPIFLREKFIAEDAQHAMSYPVCGVLYEKRIDDFLEKRTALDR